MFAKLISYIKRHSVIAILIALIIILGIVNGEGRSASFGLLFIFFLILLYFLPSIVAYKRKRKNAQAILLLNLLLGWTVIGWIVSIVWAVSEDK